MPARANGPVARAVDAACRRPMAVLVAALLLALAAGAYAATHFAMTTDSTALISPDVGWRVNERRLDAAFPQNGDAILVVVDGATAELAETASAALADRLAVDRAHFRGVTRPDGGQFFAREGLLFRSQADVAAATARMVEAQPFLGPLAADPSLRGIADALGTMISGVDRGEADIARIDRPMAALADALEAQAAGRPAYFSWQALLGDGDKEGALEAPRRRLILVRPILDYGALQPGMAASDAIRAAARALALDPAHGVTVRLTGSVPLSDEEFSSLADKAWLVAMVMIAAMLGTLWLATRSGRLVAAIMLTTLAGLVVTAAIGLIAVGRFNLISVAFIPLFVGLGVDFGIQIAVRFQAERHGGASPADALRGAATALGAPLLLAAGAVCLGFLAFLPTDYVGIAELGIISGIGMIVALAFSATLLPALILLLRPGRPRAEVGTPALAPADAFLIQRRKLVLGLFGLSMVVSIIALPAVRFDFNPLHLKAPDAEAMATLTDLMHDPDRNPNVIDILAPDLPAARRLAARLEALPEVGRVMTIESFVPEGQAEKLATIADARLLLDLTLDPLEPLPPPSDADTVAALRRTAAALASHGENANARRLAKALSTLAGAPPEARNKARAMLVPPLEAMLAQLRAALSAEPVTLTDIPADLKRDWLAPKGGVRVQAVPRAAGNDNEALARFTRAVRAIAPDATGVAISTQEGARTVAHAFVHAGLLALAAISLLLFAVLRDLREVAFTLAPVVLSGFLTLGTCVLIGQPINFANIIAFPLLFGVGVAFHIYFVMAWRAGAADLLQSSLARAIFFSALATGTAFGSLWLSSHPGTASMGKILMLSLAWTLVCALIFEPALLGPPRKDQR
ncbi:MMPL family transporter [Sphingomonas fennica]|uniref:Hopanoid biosynthesis-associated RND transporter HpnN n=1 Tax=Edaphosphingomonas fennica TaxID=114404 RepID=A0A2T4HXE0_9SPHN|nr:MMPL family transporter [Sphingomonas fennica]PTD20473.1 hopanoid biosynthesis-associated RND transporter HpnN [Sphingomonas fennica]